MMKEKKKTFQTGIILFVQAFSMLKKVISLHLIMVLAEQYDYVIF